MIQVVRKPLTLGQRMDLIDRLGRELQRLYTFPEIEIVIKAARLNGLSDSERRDSKWAYVKERLAGVAEQDLQRFALEVGVQPVVNPGEGGNVVSPLLDPPGMWRDTDQFRLFISHVSKHKARAHRLKEALAPYGVSAFVAHDDIEPTKRWRDEILRALQTMDGFVAMLAPGFSASVWCNQEVGFAVGSGAMIISFRMSEDPPGFLGEEQALPWRKGQMAEDVAKGIVDLLKKDERTLARMGMAQESASKKAGRAHFAYKDGKDIVTYR